MTQIKLANQKLNKTKVGWISYWNLAPLGYELQRMAGKDLELVFGTPSKINKLLSEGQVTVAPCSSVCLVKNEHHDIAMPIGIAANGPVQSVYLGIKEDNGVFEMVRKRQTLLKEIFVTALGQHQGDCRRTTEAIFTMASGLECEKLAYTPGLCLTPASAAGANLAKVLYRLWFGAESYELMVERRLSRGTSGGEYTCDMELIIGDEALQKRPQYKYIIDLGEAWKELTNLPFVFAVWQTAGKAIHPALKAKIMEAADLAQARMRIEPAAYLQNDPGVDVNGRPIDLANYWRAIQYRLTATHFRGLALYLSLVRYLNPTIVSANAVTNIMKWESIGASQSL